MRRSSKDSRAKEKERIFVEIDLGKIERNYNLIKGKVGKEVDVLAVVKADAYGHGIIEVSRRLSLAGCNFFGVSTIEEGIELRKAKIGGRILVLGGILPFDGERSILKYDLTPVVHEIEGLKRLLGLAKRSGKKIPFHIKFDTGMGRLGFMPEEAGALVEFLRNESSLLVDGIMSHFSSSEERDSYGLGQIEIFSKIVDFFRLSGINPKYVHMANTGAVINYPESHFNMVRVGIGIYGTYPSRNLEGALPIEEALSLKGRIAFLKDFEEGSFLSYGRTYRTNRKTKIAFVPFGYGEGYRRELSNCASVIVRGKRCPVVGRICMDWTLIDVTETEAQKGDPVIFLGCEGKERITAWELAEKLKTIPYEIFCGISKSVKRYYL